MKKLNTIAITCLAVSGLAGWALAQDLSTGTYSTPATSSSSSLVAPRTGLYSVVTKNNGAGDNTVEDFTRRPTLIGDKQYFAGYGGSDMLSGAFSFQGIGLNWFGAMVGGGISNDEVRFGVGSGNAWGGGVILALAKTNVETAAGKTKTVLEGDGFGVFGDFGLGNSDVYGQVAMYTDFNGPAGGPGGFNYVKVEPAVGPESETTYRLINIMAGWKKDATTEGTHSLNVEAAYNMGSHEVDPSTPAIDTKVNELGVLFAHGYILKASTDYSVFLGVNTGLQWHAESFEAAPTDRDNIGLFASPNMAFQKNLGKGFEVFSGGSVTASYSQSSNIPVGEVEASALLTGGADVALGLRWVKDNFALEGSISENLLQTGPYFISGNDNASGMFLQVGMSLGI
ncbi:MAG: hypothetical protein M3Y08_15230 [Fibrobacterota bacterium]|nr:hypothetical protein [Fibrobacterota bacterium]